LRIILISKGYLGNSRKVEEWEIREQYPIEKVLFVFLKFFKGVVMRGLFVFFGIYGSDVGAPGGLRRNPHRGYDLRTGPVELRF
jgi:hypothetical protein